MRGGLQSRARSVFVIGARVTCSKYRQRPLHLQLFCSGWPSRDPESADAQPNGLERPQALWLMLQAWIGLRDMRLRRDWRENGIRMRMHLRISFVDGSVGAQAL